MKRFLILIAALYLIIGSLSAQNITGAWYGNPDLGGVTVRLIFNITEADGAYSGTMQSPDQTDQLFPIGSVELAGGELKITVPALGFVYQGRLTGEKIEGSFTQMGRTYPMELTRSEQTASRPQTSLTAQDITGTWYGAPYLGGKLTRLVFNITEVGGTYGGTMRSPDQGDQSIPLGSVELAGGELIIAIPALDFIYRGRVSGERIDGAFTQRGGTVRVELTREEQIINRPQEPKPKYPYDIEDVTFRNEAAGITLAGTLTVPWGDDRRLCDRCLVGVGMAEKPA